MAADFFEDQRIAKKKTTYLIFLFILAVITIIALVYFAATITIGFVIPQAHIYMATHHTGGGSMNINYSHNGELMPPFSWWRPQILLGSVLGTILVIAVCCGYRIVQLRMSGGEGVATTLGGVYVTHDTADAKQKQLLNVVEEMAIASGTAVPKVFVLTGEHSINAFAAGFTPNTAVIAVSQGALNLLSRDELQGVIGHEFSHILNGDMRTNVRIIGVIFGIIALTILGSILLRAIFFAGSGQSRSNERGGGGGIMLAIAAFGLLLIVIGYVGMFFGKLIQAAISRQREFLADASAVQFTRNPEGIAGALKKMGGINSQSRLISPHASQVAHMCFGSVSMFGGPMATHPPLKTRIKKILPSFDGIFPEVEINSPVDETTTYQDIKRRVKASQEAVSGHGDKLSKEEARQQMMQGILAASVLTGTNANTKNGSTDTKASDHIGRPTQAHFAYATQLIKDLPQSLKDAAHDPHDARAVVYAILLSDKLQVQRSQLATLEKTTEEHVYKTVKNLANDINKVAQSSRLPLLDMAVPALHKLSKNQYDAFIANVNNLVSADHKVEMFEWAIQRTVHHRLDEHFEKAKPVRQHYKKLNLVSSDVALLLSALALIGTDNKEQAQNAFDAAQKVVEISNLQFFKPDTCSHENLEKALDTLAQLTPNPKRTLINAAVAAITEDKSITLRESELLRIICDSLDCPMPPMI